MPKPKQMRVAELVFDATLYPRHEIDKHNVQALRNAIRAGASLPPIIACKESLRIVDGVHRQRAIIDEGGADAEHEVELRAYADDAARLAEAIRLNAAHGVKLQRYDWAHCMVIAERVGLSSDDLASAFNVTRETFAMATRDRFAKVSRSHTAHSPPAPLKRTVRHMAGTTLTATQVKANDRLSGMSQVFYVNQIIELLESNMLDLDDQKLLQRMMHLAKLIDKLEIQNLIAVPADAP